MTRTKGDTWPSGPKQLAQIDTWLKEIRAGKLPSDPASVAPKAEQEG